ncbi:MAG: M23 family metallopeptidase [Actinomycetota bacterium]|nr:M23 family metallopeptidase [Actinomycetota bacterium]
MSSRLNPRFTGLLAVVLVGAVLALPGPAAKAHHGEAPPEMAFPQEADKTTFNNDWGDGRSGGRRHTGTDMMASAKMVEVYALADGVVTKISERSRPGRYLYVEHEGGWTSLYLHLNDDNPGTDDGKAPWSLTLAPGIEVGSEVKAGQVIGWTGDSGNAEGASPHTHFELHLNGRAVNPYPYLKDAYDRDLADMTRREKLAIYQMLGSTLID